jgi:acyl-CoA synthetase (AMP-forming)/AMP-acid ligase II
MPYYEDIVFLSDIPRYHSAHNPDQIAFVYENKETSYKDFNIRTEKVANGLV